MARGRRGNGVLADILKEATERAMRSEMRKAIRQTGGSLVPMARALGVKIDTVKRWATLLGFRLEPDGHRTRVVEE